MAISNPCFMASKIVSFSGEETTFLLPASTSNIAQAMRIHTAGATRGGGRGSHSFTPT